MPGFAVEGPRRWTHRLYALAFRRFRPRRLRAFYEALGLQQGASVLDVGGTPYFWRLAAELGLPPLRVTLVNLAAPRDPLPPGSRALVADGTALPFPDRGFDAVFCNSVIEHAGSLEKQQRLAREIRRVGRAYFVQTPSRRFPVEQHLVTLFLHWLPKQIQKRWAGRLSLAGTEGRLPRAALERFLDELRLLTREEMAALFPDSEQRVERLFGLEKSLLAIRRQP
jgi:hypothetical protein